MGGAVQFRQSAIELRYRADREVLERVVDSTDERDSPTPRHEHDAIAQIEVLDRMRREHDRRRPVGKLPELSDQLHARGRVETGRRLVEEEDARFGQKLDRNACTLTLPTAQGANPDLGVLAEPDRVDCSRDRVVDLGASRRRREPQPCRVTERVLQREIGMDDVVLWHVADDAAELPQVRVHVNAIEAHRSRARRGNAGDRVQQRCLARAARTDDRDELPDGHRERHAVQERDLAPTPDPDAPRQVIDADAKAPRLDARGRRSCRAALKPTIAIP